MTDTPELFSGLLRHTVPGGVLPIAPMADNIPMTATQLREFQEQAHADALIYTLGYREGLEAAAVYHDRHAEGYGRTRSRLDEAAHRTHAAAIRDMATDK